MKYPDRFKMNMIRQMTGPEPMTAGALSEKVGIAQTTLSRWLREACVAETHPEMDAATGMAHEVNAVMTSPKRPQDWPPEEKFKAVLEATRLPGDELGAFLRRKGIHETHLQQWRYQMLGGLQNRPADKKKMKNSPEHKRIRQLEKEITRKDKALAETAALLVLKKKVQAIWGDEDDDTSKRSGK